jgi:predicted XRE-type DNA-binding protein
MHPQRSPLDDPVPALKVQLALEIVTALDGWSEGNAAAWLRTDCRRVSDLRAGRLRRFSLQKLIRLAATIGRRVDLMVTWPGHFSALGKDGERPNSVTVISSLNGTSGSFAALAKIRDNSRGTRHPTDE